MTINDILLPYQREFLAAPQHRKMWISSRQVGKSFALAVALSKGALSRKNGLSLCVSVNSRSASEIIQKCKTVAEAICKLANGALSWKAGFDHVQFSNGCRILSLPSTCESLRGFTAQCVAIDEAAFIYRLDEVLQSIGPTLTRDKNADLILATTPAGRNGPFYELYLKAKDDPEWHLQTTTIHDAIRMGLDVDLASLRTICPDLDVFAQEYECVFQSEYGAWIDPESLVSEDIPEKRSSQSWLGLDVGVKNDASGIAVAYESAGRLVFDFLGYLRKTSFEDQLKFIKQLQTSKAIAAGYVDAVGIGYGLSERIQKEVNWKIKPFNWTATNKTPAYEAFKADVLQKKVVFSSKFIDMAKDDIRLVKKIVTPDGHVKYSSDRTSLGHGDLASAIVLCHQAWRDMPASMSMPQPVPMMSIF